MARWSPLCHSCHRERFAHDTLAGLRVAARLLERHPLHAEYGPHFVPGRSSSESPVSCVRRSDMPHRSWLVLPVAAIATLNVLTSAAQGQTRPPTPLTYEWVITTSWKDLHDKILQMAKDTVFPDDKLE